MTERPPPTPWWASGRRPDEGLDADEDPVAAHQRARRGDGGVGAGAAGDDDAARGGAGGDAGGADGRAWWEDTAEALAGAVREAARAGRDPASGPVEDHEHGSGAPACRICPVCIAIRALGESRPEVVAHLGEAVRHLALALKAFADAQVAAAGGADRLERIDLDDQ